MYNKSYFLPSEQFSYISEYTQNKGLAPPFLKPGI